MAGKRKRKEPETISVWLFEAETSDVPEQKNFETLRVPVTRASAMRIKPFPKCRLVRGRIIRDADYRRLLKAARKRAK